MLSKVDTCFFSHGGARRLGRRQRFQKGFDYGCLALGFKTSMTALDTVRLMFLEDSLITCYGLCGTLSRVVFVTFAGQLCQMRLRLGVQAVQVLLVVRRSFVLWYRLGRVYHNLCTCGRIFATHSAFIWCLREARHGFSLLRPRSPLNRSLRFSSSGRKAVQLHTLL